MDLVNLTSDKISIEDVITSVNSPKCGAVSSFIGTTRDNFENKKVSRYACILIDFQTVKF